MENNEISKSNKIKIIVITALIFLVSIAGISYAYFTIQIVGNETASSMRLRTANMSLIYNDVQIASGEYIEPGWTQTKTLTVYNNGNVDAYYNIIWRDLINEIINGELVISATCASSPSGSCSNISETVVPTSMSESHNITVKRGISIAPGVTHTYTLTALFKETGSNQNYNQNKEFYGTLNIAEGSAPATIRLTTDNSTAGLSTHDIVTISQGSNINEEFYVVRTNATNTTLLAKYNLYVGNIYSDLGTTLVKRLTSADAGYGLQSEGAIGYDMTNNRVVATVPFSNTNYWSSYTSEQLSNIYNANLSSTEDWSNIGYSIAYYVEEYVDRLGVNGTGMLVNENWPEYNNNACYWLGNANNNGTLNAMFYLDGENDKIVGIQDYDDPQFYGVRPVIVVNTSDIQSS